MKTEFKHFGKTTICLLTSKKTGMQFYGESTCAPEDHYDERRGDYIAESRAMIALLRHCRTSLEETILSQKHLINCMEQSKKFNPKNNEFRLLKRDYHQNIAALQEIRDEIKRQKASIKYYSQHIR